MLREAQAFASQWWMRVPVLSWGRIMGKLRVVSLSLVELNTARRLPSLVSGGGAGDSKTHHEENMHRDRGVSGITHQHRDVQERSTLPPMNVFQKAV